MKKNNIISGMALASLLQLSNIAFAGNDSGNGEVDISQVAAGKYVTGEKARVGNRDLLIVKFVGNIDFSTPLQLQSALEDSQGRDVLIYIDSGGGIVAAGDIVIDMLTHFQKMKKTDGKIVAAYVGNVCASMCLPVFYSVENRFANPVAKFGFHSVSVNGAPANRETFDYVTSFILIGATRSDAPTMNFVMDLLEDKSLSTTNLTWFSSSQLAGKEAFVTAGRVISPDQMLGKYKKQGFAAKVNQVSRMENGTCANKFIQPEAEVLILPGEAQKSSQVRIMVTKHVGNEFAPLPLCEAEVDLNSLTKF